MSREITKNNCIADWPINEQPREKILQSGGEILTDAELLAIILGTGIKGKNAVDLSRDIIKNFSTFRNIGMANFEKIKNFAGLGPAKIARIKAVIEIAKRFQEENIIKRGEKIQSAKTVVTALNSRMRDMPKEVFKIIILDAGNKIIKIKDLTTGTVNRAIPIIREIFHSAIESHGVSIICVHNHPSGNTQPSEEDKIFTKDLSDSGKLMEIPVLDHIIIGNNGYYSFAEQGTL
ncbi:DNA repair protein radC [Candidatus Omnitrophus magneticus]|uniref:DNA repair protein radC n=1 Tax=Candidatus Omnitrophus magneticus TaxID=1609969 RepID=A0A0F0CTV6_9BACT|nr:DNA repair protein radC [Candidatus Omnitrophus magneticus]